MTVETSFGTLEYAVMGEGEPVLIVHGACGGFDQGIEIAEALARRGYWVIAPSRFGYLRSALPRKLTTAMQADAYAQLLDHLCIEKAVVVGISAGAGHPCNSPSVNPNAAAPWRYLSPPITCRQGRPTMAASLPARFSTPISSPGQP